MKRLPITALLLVLSASLPALAATPRVTDPDLPRALPQEGPVSVSWTDPAQFSELRFSGNRWEADRGDWVNQLAEYLQDRASKRLPDGQRMDVTITDIQRAGRYEPWRGIQMDSVRILRDTYPPRMTVNVRITDADGQVLEEGERKLYDTNYLMNGSVGNTDPLRHEKRMIDDWLRRELPAPPRA
ncbi:hypothetical protein B1992_07475 [Pseudoxanthomonas broegbernensis]|uniref:DUF3016 domain-containing protein n=1 Tax=Pseudoxanthomonas broegbernensis TaxID=83619 RepID=A0A7V8K760_9GAMM|nr:DUF3016 domain-containing protein [Pseudoxanthomonas broegbernensis]KAF1686733.1 hypothetical protein B1992_07475 [Pseudoxanthomonas broegbernensis]MBB6063499.1 hypothetical protein [Pseudoxanthomonas broegbernensis]